MPKEYGQGVLVDKERPNIEKVRELIEQLKAKQVEITAAIEKAEKTFGIKESEKGGSESATASTESSALAASDESATPEKTPEQLAAQEKQLKLAEAQQLYAEYDALLGKHKGFPLANQRDADVYPDFQKYNQLREEINKLKRQFDLSDEEIQAPTLKKMEAERTQEKQGKLAEAQQLYAEIYTLLIKHKGFPLAHQRDEDVYPDLQKYYSMQRELQELQRRYSLTGAEVEGLTHEKIKEEREAERQTALSEVQQLSAELKQLTTDNNGFSIEDRQKPEMQKAFTNRRELENRITLLRREHGFTEAEINTPDSQLAAN
jgi:hypothetical protein